MINFLKMIGSVFRPADAPVRFHSGGVVGPNSGRISFETILTPADAFVKRQLAKKGFHVTLNMNNQTRKRPITDDMTQMCADLGIEPTTSYADFQATLMEALAKSVGIPREKMGRSWR